MIKNKVKRAYVFTRYYKISYPLQFVNNSTHKALQVQKINKMASVNSWPGVEIHESTYYRWVLVLSWSSQSQKFSIVKERGLEWHCSQLDVIRAGEKAKRNIIEKETTIDDGNNSFYLLTEKKKEMIFETVRKRSFMCEKCFDHCANCC